MKADYALGSLNRPKLGLPIFPLKNTSQFDMSKKGVLKGMAPQGVSDVSGLVEL